MLTEELLFGGVETAMSRRLFSVAYPLAPQATDPEVQERFAEQLAALADVYVNDAFGSWQVSCAGHCHFPRYGH
jgi:3-phosphoglycerate kinase